MTLRQLGIFCSRTCRLETLRQKGISYSYQLARENLQDLACILRWNYKHGFFVYRMSSEMFPFATHPDYASQYDLSQFTDLFTDLQRVVKTYNQRLTFHPGQYNQLTSSNERVVKQAVIDINFHAEILDKLGVGANGVICIHGGSKADGKDVCLERFKQNFKLLSPSAQNRLVLENCEMAYTVEDLLPVSETLKIPVVIDFHHDDINPGAQPVEHYFSRVFQVWHQRGIKPKVHLSNSVPGISKSDNIMLRRKHSDYISYSFTSLETIKHDIDIMLECKQKELAIFKLRSST